MDETAFQIDTWTRVSGYAIPLIITLMGCQMPVMGRERIIVCYIY